MIKVQFTLDQDSYKPKQGYKTDSGWDLFVNEDVTIYPGEFKDIHTGVSMRMGPGIWGFITGRSSTGRKHGLRVENGVIDNGYTGELFIGVWNITDKPVTISRGMRLAQLIFFDNVSVEWERVAELPETDRGSAGFGSTGVGHSE